MPKLPIDYSKGFIYKLCCKDKSIEECYIGSSTNWKQRKRTHKSNCNNPNQKSYNNKKYVVIRDNGGWENWEMVLIHYYPCNNKRELESEEERVRQEYHNTINSKRAYRTDEERKEYNKQYYTDNREKLLQKAKQYNIDNHESILEYKKQYRIDNRESILQKEKQYRTDNCESILQKKKQKITCDCGCIIAKRNISTHKKSNKHKKIMEQNN